MHEFTISTVLVLAAVVVILGWMLWEDLRYRAISLWTFPVLFAVLLLSQAYQRSWEQVLFQTSLNFMLIALQLSALWLYLILKHQALVHPMRGFLGWGDVLFWMAIAPAFSPLSFLLFYIGSSLLALLLHSMLQSRPWYGEAGKVPLAGIQALAYSGWLLFYGLTDSPTWLAQL